MTENYLNYLEEENKLEKNIDYIKFWLDRKRN